MTTPTEQPEAMRLADRLASNIVTGHDWPNTNDELLRVQCATELRRLHAENEALREQNQAQRDEWLAWDAKRKDLERDAERYRWLRTNKPYVISVAGVTIHCGGHVPISAVRFGPSLDRAVDAAIKALEQRAGES